MQRKIQLLKWALLLLILLIVGEAAFSGTLLPAKAAPLNGETCQLIWAPGGNTPLDPSQVTDKGLRDTLGGYQVQCPSPHGTCQLVLSGGDTGLDLSNIPSTDYVPTQLQKDGYNISTPLKCSGTSGPSSTNDFDNSNGRPSCTLVWDPNAPIQLKFDQVQDQSLITTLQGKTGLNNCTEGVS